MESPTTDQEPRLGEQPEIDFLILADRAEAINGKLYMMGGGWDRLGVVDFAQPVSFSLAVGILVPWPLTNQEHAARIWIEHEDGVQVGPDITVGVNMGRPPIAVPGQTFRALIAVNAAWRLLRPGTYCVKASVAGCQPKRVAFHASQAQSAGARPGRP